MTIVAIAKPKGKAIECEVERLAEDIWLLEDGGAVSFIDLFIQNRSVPIEKLRLVSIGKINQVSDVTHWFKDFALKWAKSVASDQYDRGMNILFSKGDLSYMQIDGLSTNISLNKSKIFYESFISPINRSGTIVELNFDPMIQPSEARALKISYHVPNLSKKEDTEWSLHLYPYCSWGVGGAGYLSQRGIDEGDLITVKKYYIQAILLPEFDFDYSRTTELKSVDESPCDGCNRFCPYASSLFKDVRIARARRLFLRWKRENLQRWTDTTLIHLHYYSKSKVAKTILEKMIKKITPRYSGMGAYILWNLEISTLPLSAADIHTNLLLRNEQITLAGLYYKLNQLIKEGLIEPVKVKPKWRGRPAIRYKITEKGRKAIGF